MPLRRITAQSRSLQDDYREHLDYPGNSELLAFLPFLEQACTGEDVWALTSHFRIMLLAADDWKSPWLISIEHYHAAYQVSYWLPADEAPFPGASVRGSREHPDEAAEIVRLALRLSGGWPQV